MKTVKLQIPMDETVRKGLEIRARELGFDSAQAYIRVWAKAQAERRPIYLGDDWGEPSDEAAARLNRWSHELDEEIKAGKSKSFTIVEAFMEDLRS